LVQARLSITRACRIAGLSRAAYYKRPTSASERDAEVIEALNAIVSRRGRWGFWKCFTRLRLDGCCWNKKRVHRVYCDMGLNLPRRCKKRLPDRPRQPLDPESEPNRCRALDFMHDALYCGRRFRTLNVIDEAIRDAWPSRLARRPIRQADPRLEPPDRLLRNTGCNSPGQWAGDDL
jgi:putative transposase